MTNNIFRTYLCIKKKHIM